MGFKSKKEEQEYKRRYYEARKQKYNDWQRANVRRKKAFTDRYKRIVGCKHCGISSPPEVLCYHHTDPSKKDKAVSFLVSNKASISRIKEEIRKCVVLCHNCHTIEHLRLEKTRERIPGVL